MRIPKRHHALAASVSALALLAGAPVDAHPPDAPFDNTVFAPIDDENGIAIDLEIVASGLVAPLKGVLAPGERNRIYVVDQTGQLWAIRLSNGAKTLFLDLSSRLVTLGVAGPGSFDERGFLGVAFHPSYQKNGKLYTYTSEPNNGPPTFPTTIPEGKVADHQNVVAEWVANDPGNPAAGVNPASRQELMRVDWPQFNHDAGDINFGPDGKLYIPMGDGGGADDQDGQPFAGADMFGHGNGNAQNLSVPLGKIHRIDVDRRNSANGQYGIPRSNPFYRTPGAVKEIWAYGLRNPFRLSFDTRSGRLYAGDVGQNDIEELDLIVKGGNYGWNRKEGTLCFDGRGVLDGVATPDCSTLPPLPRRLRDPVAQFDTHHEGHSVIGGFVYHGKSIPQLRGRYVFAEWSRLFGFPLGPDNFGRILYLRSRNLRPGQLATIKEVSNFHEVATELGLTNPAQPPAAFDQTLSVLGFAQDRNGEVYVLGNKTGRPFGSGGVVLKLGPADND
jgi:glucose/arabinose dehydrogenase